MFDQKTQLRDRLDFAVKTARQCGLPVKDCFEIVEEFYWALQGDNYLADHYGGEDQVPPRLEIPIPKFPIRVDPSMPPGEFKLEQRGGGGSPL